MQLRDKVILHNLTRKKLLPFPIEFDELNCLKIEKKLNRLWINLNVLFKTIY